MKHYTEVEIYTNGRLRAHGMVGDRWRTINAGQEAWYFIGRLTGCAVTSLNAAIDLAHRCCADHRGKHCEVRIHHVKYG